MNKRQRKKRNKLMCKDVIYLKLYINENDNYNPEIKCKGFNQWYRRAVHYGKKYNCNVGYYNPDAEKRADEYFKKEYGE